MENYNEKNMKKKYFSCSGAVSRLFSLFILLASLLVLPKAQATIGDSFTIDRLKYTVLTEDKTFKTGTVSVQTESTEISGDIEIPASVANGGINYSVTLIRANAFSDCHSLTGITIPDSVTSIGDGAFYWCSGLTSIVIPSGVTSIEGGTFRFCSSLTSIVIPDSVTYIGGSALSECKSLTNIIIPNSVTFIGDYAFEYCSNLTSIIIPDSVTFIGIRVFQNCSNLTEIVVGKNNPNFSSLEGVLLNKDQTVVIQCPSGKGACTIPESVTSIGYYAFYNCHSLTSIIIPDNVISISEYAFSGCSSLTSVTIGNGVTSIGSSAFRVCSNLTSVTIGNGVTSIDNWSFSGCSKLTSITIPSSVTVIGYGAFEDCSSLKSIVIPNSVTSIKGGAFSGCIGLTGVYFEGNAPLLPEGNVFFAPAVIYYLPETTGWTTPWSGRPATLWIELPEITEQPQSYAVIEGDSVTFSVVAKGTEPLYFQWYKEGVAIENATGTSYTIESVNAGDLGNYIVVVSNESGEATSTVATLTLKVPYRATATVQVVNGFVVGLHLTDGGWGYTREPKIRIKDETGSGATGHCIIENGVVTQIIIDNPGSNYSGEATILIGSPFSNSSLDIAVSEVKVKMHLVLGMEYQLWSSIDCINWEQVGETFTAEEEEMDIRFQVEDYGRFFKLQEI